MDGSAGDRGGLGRMRPSPDRRERARALERTAIWNSVLGYHGPYNVMNDGQPAQ